MKRTGFIRMVSLILCMSIMFVSIPITAFAFNNFDVEVVTKDAPIRKEASVFAKTLRKAAKGSTLTVVGEERNIFGNLWYKVSGGGYIYNSDVKKVHVHNNVFVGYEDMHPHYSMYECSCGKSGYCGTETTKVDGCKQCYPHVHNYKLVGYESMHPHSAKYECSCGSGYCGTDSKKVENCKQCYPHVHNYKLIGYENAHPHSAKYECSCGFGYCGTQTTKVEGCEQCYPKVHTHNYKLVGYEKTHPHLANYACSCGAGYCGTETIESLECEICYPHEHEYLHLGYEEEHPHYAIYECVCGAGYCGTKTIKHKDCEICYPKTVEHVHNYVLIEYEEEHPHYALYECSCGFGYCGTKKNKLKDCEICYPKEEHVYIITGYEEEHPHYAILKCLDCGETIIDNSVTGIDETYCFECASTAFNPLDKYSGASLPIYSINNNKVTYASIKEKGEVFDLSEALHLSLDVCGLAPGFGAVCDGVNVLYYLIEGKYADAVLSGIAFIPFVGYVGAGGKVVKKSGALLIEGTGELFSEATGKTIKYTVNNYDTLNRTSRLVIRNSSDYADETVEAVAKIANNEDVLLENVYLNGKLLIDDKYAGTITSSAGLNYKVASKNKNQIFHILDRHSSSVEVSYRRRFQNKEISELPNFFNISDEEIFKLVDDTYLNRTHIPGSENIVGITVSYDYDIGRKIGTLNETKLRIVYETGTTNIITVYPIK